MSFENYNTRINHGLINYYTQNSLLTNLNLSEINLYRYVSNRLIYDDYLFKLNEYSKINYELTQYEGKNIKKKNYLNHIQFKKDYLQKIKIEFIDNFFNLNQFSSNYLNNEEIDIEKEIDDFYQDS